MIDTTLRASTPGMTGAVTARASAEPASTGPVESLERGHQENLGLMPRPPAGAEQSPIDTLSTAAGAAAAPGTDPTGDVVFSWLPQDASVMSPTTVVAHDVRPGPALPRVKPADDYGCDEMFNANEKGQYVFDPGDYRFPKVVAMVTAERTLEMFEKALGHGVEFAFPGSELKIYTGGGSLGSNYMRGLGSINFGCEPDPATNRLVHGATSTDMVAHETAHAVLDGVHPEYIDIQKSIYPRSFHESFGDMTAVLVSLLDDATRARVVEQTGGDLAKPNVAANLYEEAGIVENHKAGHDVTGGDYLRTALNAFKWQEPSTLPKEGGFDQLKADPHSFSQVFTGAMYDVLRSVTDRNREAGQGPDDAVKHAAEEMLGLYAQLLSGTAPKGDFTFQDMGMALLKADELATGGRDRQILTEIFRDRKIFPDGFPATASLTTT